MEEDIKALEELKGIFIHLKNYGWINDIKRDVDTDKVIQAIENLIKGYKELKEKVNKVEDNYIEKSKVSKYLNKMEKRCDKPKFSVMKKEIEQLLQEGDK